MLQTFDDGSTYDSDTGTATQSPPGYTLSDYYKNFQPSNVSNGATNWADVLKYGFGRVVDYKTASLTAQNAQPQYAMPVAPAQPQPYGISNGTLLLLGGAALLFFVLSQKG